MNNEITFPGPNIPNIPHIQDVQDVILYIISDVLNTIKRSDRDFYSGVQSQNHVCIIKTRWVLGFLDICDFGLRRNLLYPKKNNSRCTSHIRAGKGYETFDLLLLFQRLLPYGSHWLFIWYLSRTLYHRSSGSGIRIFL